MKEYIYELTNPETRVWNHGVNVMLLDWHRAASMRLNLSCLFVDREPLLPEELERLNLWIKGGGAWRLSGLQHWDAERELFRFLGREVNDPLPPGPNGAGRWTCLPPPDSLPPRGRPGST